jgi:hypothetical protein
MANCKLTIELDEPNRARTAGEPVTGSVIVTAEEDVNCKALVVTSGWSTHGRGNVASGEAERKTLFQGSWQSNKEYRYPFTLATAAWPPTYYGQFLNVSQSVTATADIPWAFDPKTVAEYRVVATSTPDDLSPTNNKPKSSSWIGWLFGSTILLFFLAAMLPLAMIITPIAVLGFGGYWFFMKFLPKQITGEVTFQVEPDSLTPGQSLRGTCEFTPKRNSAINAVTWTVRCAEVCTSGSGSNRKTHTQEVLNKTHPLMEAGTLVAGQRYRYEFAYELPATAPPSMTFTDNRIEWSSELRIDIPRWPDWAKNVPLVVKVAPSIPAASTFVASGDIAPSNQVVTPHDDDEPWLTEVLQQIFQSHHDPERLEVVLDAVRGQTFPIQVDTQGEVEEPYEAEIDDPGSWVSAIDTRRNARMVLFIPASFDARNIQWLSGWNSEASIHGFESETGRVIMQVAGPMAP